jgi:hypothetical protein
MSVPISTIGHGRAHDVDAGQGLEKFHGPHVVVESTRQEIAWPIDVIFQFPYMGQGILEQGTVNVVQIILE